MWIMKNQENIKLKKCESICFKSTIPYPWYEQKLAKFNLVHDIKAPLPFDNLIFVKTDVAWT